MKRPDDHVVFVAGGFRCRHCNAHRNVATPIDVRVFVEESRLFLSQHRQCATTTTETTTDDTEQVAA